MNWPRVRTLWHRELRDLMRDRRTLFMILVLPTVLYPLMAIIAYAFALGTVTQTSTIGVVGAQYLPQPGAETVCPIPELAWLSLAPTGGVDQIACSAALYQTIQAAQKYPPLVIDGQIPAEFWDIALDGQATHIQTLPDASLAPLEARDVDLILVVPADFRSRLDSGGHSTLEIHTRESDERSRLAERRLREAMGNWKARLQQVRLMRQGLPRDFDDPVTLRVPRHDDEPHRRDIEELSDMVARFFPFMLIMWAMAGALYPAIDVCAGEKERGTLETLLLSPASRAEIVMGKFLAVWLFSAVTAWWNFAWLGGGAWLSGSVLPFQIIRPSSLFWCSVLILVLSGLFSAVSLALGAYARSTKEGQYYLLPLFLVTMPLTFLPLVPGVELNWFYSLIPVTGATLLLQRLMSPAPEARTWLYFIPVLLSLAVSIALALWWAVAQFRREEVLFREAERLNLGAWVRRLFGRKAPQINADEHRETPV